MSHLNFEINSVVCQPLFYPCYICNHLLVSFQAGFVNANAAVAKVKPSDFRQAAERACSLSVKNAEATFPGVPKDNIPYICMDLVYQYTLLVDGFGMTWSNETNQNSIKVVSAFSLILQTFLQVLIPTMR